MQKPRLMTPGPSPVPPEVLLQLARPVRHHRTAAFRHTLARVQEKLRWLFGTSQPVLVLTASGTGAMDAAVSNLLCSGDRVVVAAAGRFGVRWQQIAERLRARVELLRVPPGDSVEPQQLADVLERAPGTVAVFATYCETSTGAAHDVRALCETAHRYGALFVLDAISAAGGMELRVDDWELDVVVAGSQKALMLPPGLAFVAVREPAWDRIRRHPARPFYFDLCKMLEKAEQNDTPFTPAHTLIAALDRALELMEREGVENIWRRHRRMAAACRAGVSALGLELFPRRPADVLTAVRAPEGVAVGELLGWLERTYGVKFAGGQDELKGKLFRIAHMGYMDELDVVAGLAALEQALWRLGWQAAEPGAAVAAAQRSLHAETSVQADA